MCNVKSKEMQGNREYIFDFERLEVYKKSLDFVKKIFKLTDKFSINYQYSLGDQLKRAALSIVNNIAEGSGKISKKAKSQFYRIAINSARECVPMLTIVKDEKMNPDQNTNTLRQQCVYICNMLGRLINSLK